MNLQYPYIACFITDDDKLACVHVRKPSELDPQTFSIPLHALNDDGLDKAYTRIGQMVLPALSLYHPVKWLRFPNLRAVHPEVLEIDLITRLISKLHKSGDATLIPLINRLAAELVTRAPEMADEPWLKTWPQIRAGFEKIPE